MQIYRCRCGQPLAGFASGFARTGLPFGNAFVDRAVDEALERHRSRMAAQDGYAADEHGREDRPHPSLPHRRDEGPGPLEASA